MALYTVSGNKIIAKRADNQSESFDKGAVDTFISKAKTAGFNDYIISAFLAISCKESKLKPLSENLNYSSPDRLKDFFGPFFKSPANGLKPFDPNQYIKNPEKLGNLIYNSPLRKKYRGVDDGLGNDGATDGFKYRGRGFIQITGKSLYRKYGQRVGKDLVSNPDLLLTIDASVSAAIEYYKDTIPSLKKKYSFINNLATDVNSYSLAVKIVAHATAGISRSNTDSVVVKVTNLANQYIGWTSAYVAGNPNAQAIREEENLSETESENLDNNRTENELPNNQNPDFKPNVLTQLFPPTITPEDISFDASQLTEQQKGDFILGAGTAPLVYYGGFQIEYEDISFFNLYHEGILPAIDLTFADRYGLFKGVGFPVDDTTVTIFIYSKTTRLRSIYMEFKITTFEDLSKSQYRIVGLVNLPEIFIKKFNTYANSTSHQVLQKIAKECGLGFCSNISNTNDKMNWINIGQSSVEYISNIMSNVYAGDKSFLSCYIDYYYNICYVDLEKEIQRDNSGDKGFFNNGLDIFTENKDDEATLTDLFLTTDFGALNTNMFISNYEVQNNSTKISLNKSYLTKSKYYDSVTKQLLVFDVDSLSSPESLSLKSKPSDSKFYEQNVGNAYLGKMDVFDETGGGNVHPNYNYAIVQNIINLNELSKLYLEAILPSPNYNLYIFQKIYVGLVNPKPGLIQESITHKRLTGNWLITGISYFFEGGKQYHKVFLNRRDIERDPSENPESTKKVETFEDNSNPLSPEDSQFSNTEGINNSPNLESLPVVSPSKTPNREYWTLVAILSREDNNPQSWADIAQSIYNRLGSGVYGGKTIAEVILAKGQYEPTWKFPRPGKKNIPNKEWMNIQSIEDASKATGNTVDYLRKVSEAIKNRQLQENARKFVEGRTDFFGSSQPARKMKFKVQRIAGKTNQFGWNNNYTANRLYSPPNQITQFFA